MTRVTLMFSAPILPREMGIPFDRTAFEAATAEAIQAFRLIEHVTITQLHVRGVDVDYDESVLSPEELVVRFKETANKLRDIEENRFFSTASRPITIVSTP